MLIDCDSCAVREIQCHDCVVNVLLSDTAAAEEAGRPGVELDGPERAAIAVLADSGLVPPLRLVARGGGAADPDVERPVERRSGGAGRTWRRPPRAAAG